MKVARRFAVFPLVLLAPFAFAQEAAAPAADDGAELAKKLANPIASMTSVPIKFNWDTGIGADGANRVTWVAQPVIPFSINADWNLITRTIVAYVDAEAAVPGGNDLAGLGDTLQSFWFSPTKPTASGWIWGLGAAFNYPTASNDSLGSEKWSAGPTAIVLKQTKGYTYGMLFNHLWSFAGESGRQDVSATFLQPFLSYTTKTRTTWAINTESTYDWKNSQWTVPINLSVAQLVRIGKQPVSFAFAVRGYAEAPEGGPDWGMSFTTTFLFPN